MVYKEGQRGQKGSYVRWVGAVYISQLRGPAFRPSFQDVGTNKAVGQIFGILHYSNLITQAPCSCAVGFGIFLNN
jgi:hypothetical protein